MDATIKVRVRDGWGVSIDGKSYSGGDVVEVPADVAEAWSTAGWAEPVEKPKARRQARRR
ncbi:MAG: hypothetical protein H0V07_02775 [Propionibacteriales bacterium]|nr:hypothetical protein [Propionibacteriales bacterium]